jgi:hypothetical protein
MTNIDIELHRGQIELLQDPHKYKVAVMGRRWGKSRAVTYNLLVKSLGFKGRVDPVSPQVVMGALPTAIQARKILWKPLYSLATTTFAHHFEYINKSEMLLVPKGGKPAINIVGANDQNGDRIRGTRLYYFSGDEYQDYHPKVLDDVILPAMADTDESSLLLTGTPKGKLNILYQAYMMEQTDAECWKSFNRRTEDNPFIRREEIARMKRVLPPRVYEQEMCASFMDFEGKVYSELNEDNLIPTIGNLLFSYYIFGVDWGEKHPAVSVFGVYKNADGDECYVYVNGWTNSDDRVILWDTFLDILLKLNARYKPKVVLCDPSRPASILELRKYMPSVAGYNPIEDGLSQLHSLMYQQRLLYAETVEPLGFKSYTGKDAWSEAMAYRRATARDGSITGTIADNQVDHVTDSTRYALARKKPL